jgi:hypothetical protein
MYTIHFYAAQHTDSYRAYVQTALDADLPIFATEWGVCGYDPLQSRPDLNQSQQWMTLLYNNNISWTNWAFTWKPEASSTLKEGTWITGPWTVTNWTDSNSDLTESGWFVKQQLDSAKPASVNSGSKITPDPTPEPTSKPTPGGDRDAYSIIEAKSFDSMSGIQTESCSEGGDNVGFIENGDWMMYSNVDFGSGAEGFEARVASDSIGGNIEIRLDSSSGTLVGTCTVSEIVGWQNWTTANCTVSGASGTHDLYLVFTGGSGYLFNLNWYTFTVDSTPVPTAEPTSEPTPTLSGIVSGQTYVIKAKHSGKCLDVGGVSTDDGANIQQWTYIGGNNQKWTVTDEGSGQYKIIAVHSGKCLDVYDQSIDDGTNIQQWPYWGGSCQKFTITEVETGYYKIVNVNSGKCLDVADVSTDNGGNIQQWTYVGGDNQKWSFETP